MQQKIWKFLGNLLNRFTKNKILGSIQKINSLKATLLEYKLVFLYLNKVLHA